MKATEFSDFEDWLSKLRDLLDFDSLESAVEDDIGYFESASDDLIKSLEHIYEDVSSTKNLVTCYLDDLGSGINGRNLDVVSDAKDEISYGIEELDRVKDRLSTAKDDLVNFIDYIKNVPRKNEE